MANQILDMFTSWGGRIIPSSSFFQSPASRAETYSDTGVMVTEDDMHVYKLTKLGKRVVRGGGADPEDMKILEYLWNNGSATDDQLEVVGDAWRVRRLVPKFIEEL